MAALLSRMWNAIRDWFVMFFWPRVALSDIQADTHATRAASGMMLQYLEMIIPKLDNLGVLMSEATDKLDRIDARTNDLGALVIALRDELANTSDASPEILARLGVVGDALTAILADPNNPTPPVPDPDVPDDPTPDVPSV